MKSIIEKIKNAVLRLVRLNSTPRGIAMGVAIGVFIGITPLYGLHTAMVLLSVLLIPGANKVAILAGTNISIPPIMPLITWAGYGIGRAMLGGDYPALDLTVLRNIHYRDIPRLYLPLFLGSIVLGIACAVVFFFLTYVLVRKIRDRKSRHV